MAYKPLFLEGFRRDLKRYAGLSKQIKRRVDHILQNSYHNSELLTKKAVDLRGKRSARVTRNFRIIYTVCEECINRGFKKKGYNDCPDCSKTEPDNEMIFFLVGPREKIYCG